MDTSPLSQEELDRFRDGARALGEPAARAAERALARTDVAPETINQAVRDFNGLRGSGRLAGDATRQRGVLDSALAKLGSRNSGDAEGRAAELRAANDIVRSGDLAPGTGVAMNVKRDNPVDLGDGTVVGIGPASEGDCVYRTGDGKVHLDEVKASAGTLAKKMRDHPEQLDNMVSWRNADPDNRQIGCRIGTDRDWHKLFNRMETGDSDVRAINRLADSGVPVRIGDRELSPDQLRALHNATKEAAGDARHRVQIGGMSEWFDRHVPDLDTARDFLRPYGVDFL